MRLLPLSMMAALAGFGLGRLCMVTQQKWESPSVPKSPAVATVPAVPASIPAEAEDATPVPNSLPESKLQPEEPKPMLSKRISALYQPGDPFGSAARIRAFITTLKAEDFHRFTTDVTNLPLCEILGVDPKFCDAVMDALVEQWLQVDPTSTLPGMRHLEEQFKHPAFPLNSLARVRPEIILNDLPEEASWGVSDRSILTAFATLGERDPIAARRYLERIRLPDQRKQAEESIGSGIAKRDPLAAVKIAVELQSPAVFEVAVKSAGRIGAGMVAQVLDATGGKIKLDRYADGEVMMRYPELPWADHLEAGSQRNDFNRSLIDVAAALTREERDHLLANAGRLPSGVGEQAVAAVVNTWAGDEPDKALAWALKYSSPEDSASRRNQPVSLAFSSFLKSNEAAAVEWWMRLPPSPLKQSLGNKAAGMLVNEGKVDRAISLFQPLSDEESATVAADLADALGRHDPAKAATWLNELPQEMKIEQAATDLIRRWLGKDADQAAAWVETQMEGPRREQALSAFARAASDFDPSIAAEWAGTITDRALRQKAAETIYDSISRRDSVAARKWLQSFSGVDNTWRERFLKMQQ